MSHDGEPPEDRRRRWTETLKGFQKKEEEFKENSRGCCGKPWTGCFSRGRRRCMLRDEWLANEEKRQRASEYFQRLYGWRGRDRSRSRGFKR